MGEAESLIPIFLFNLFFLLFIVGIIVFIQQYKLKKKEHLAMLTYQKEEHHKELLENHIEIQNQTMQYIGREIHDNVGQKLTLASLYTQQLGFENKAPQINENIENISLIINESLQELRELSKSLTDNSIASNTIDSLILNECDKVEKTKKCLIHYTNDEVKQDLNYEQKSILIRICQEFIQNSLKHSRCKNIQIRLKQSNSQLQFTIYDDGTGFDTSTKSSGIGLQNMKKRTLLLNGSFDFQSNINVGTKLNITLPLS